MPAGIQVWDSAGVLVVDISDRLARVLGTFNVFSGPGSRVDANLASGTPWAVVTPLSVTENGMPVVTFNTSTNTMSWTNAAAACTITYGVY